MRIGIDFDGRSLSDPRPATLTDPAPNNGPRRANVLPGVDLHAVAPGAHRDARRVGEALHEEDELPVSGADGVDEMLAGVEDQENAFVPQIRDEIGPWIVGMQRGSIRRR